MFTKVRTPSNIREVELNPLVPNAIKLRDRPALRDVVNQFVLGHWLGENGATLSPDLGGQGPHEDKVWVDQRDDAAIWRAVWATKPVLETTRSVGFRMYTYIYM